tara:strand:- start:2525 stop:6175 length:3651 start_codon:yes stop_codon:yes gene_type:complete
MPARAPVGLETAQERLKRLTTPVNQSNIDLEIPEWASTAQPVPEVAPEAPQELVESEEIPEWAIPTSSAEEVPEWAKPIQMSSDELRADEAYSLIDDDGLVGLPQGIKAYSYSENDIAENEALFNPVRDYVADRFGDQAVKDVSNEEVVNKFLNSRRGMSSGNSLRVVSEVDYLMNVKDDPERLLKAGKAYSIFEKMEGLTGEGVTWGEFGEGVKDYAGNILLDPINFVTFGIGKLFGGTALKTAGKTVEKIAMKEVTKQLMKGAGEKAAVKAGTKVTKSAVKQLTKEGTQEIAEFSAKMLADKGVKKVFTKAGLREVGAATVVDAVINSGSEFLYQKSLVDTTVQGEINKHAVGLAALASLSMGGVQAGLVAKRGFSDTALISEVVKKGTAKDIMKDLKESMAKFLDEPAEAGSWMEKVAKGEDLTKGDTEFFIDVLLGLHKGEGENNLKGLAQIMQENGHFYVKREGVKDDKISNWIADFMKEEVGQAELDDFMKVFGGNLNKGTTLTPEAFGDAFAAKMNASARSMNSVMQVAKKMDVSLEDLKKMESSDFINGLLDNNKIVLQADRYQGKGTIGANISETQNKFIRSLVSHPSTSALNVLGYGAAAGLDIATDLTMSLYKGGKGMLKTLASFDGKEDLTVAKQLLLATKDRFKFALDPDMTYAAYKSALLNNTGALDKLNRVLAGGVDIANTVEQMAKLGKGAKAQDAADTVISKIQTATFVHAQDAVTKSQEYVGQMNKLLRTEFKMGWNEFYKQPDVSKVMATKEYKQLELDAVAATMGNTFSTSFKDASKLGQVAGFVEDARNIPGLGFMVPFGRFFNNTINFGIKNTPLLNIAVKKSTGKYANETTERLAARGAVVAGLVYTMSLDEQENLRDGLGLYDEVINGEVVSQQYDYPISLFKALSRVVSYKSVGKEVPQEIVQQIIKDFGGGGLTRNLSKTSTEFSDIAEALLAAEFGEAWSESKGIGGDITAQALSGFIRPLEPIDTVLGLFMGADQSPKNTAEGNRLVGDSLKYVDNVANILLGKEDAPLKYSSAGGELNQQSAKNLGARNPQYTKTENLMNVLGVNTWSTSPSLSREKKLMIPEAVNIYQKLFFEEMEPWSDRMMDNEAFLQSSQKVQRTAWNDKVEQVKKRVKFKLAVSYEGPQTTLRQQFDIMNTYSVKDVKGALTDLELDKSIGELTISEISILKTHLKSADFIHRLGVGGEVRQ